MITNEYDPYKFHDNLIRGISFASDMDDFSSDLHFDIDHILEWVSCSTQVNESIFSVSKAILKFHNVTDLTLNISWGDSKFSEYSGSRAGMYIIEIKKEKVGSPLGEPDYYKWRIVTNDDNYVITFGASSMTLELIGQPVRVNRQYLLNSERN